MHCWQLCFLINRKSDRLTRVVPDKGRRTIVDVVIVPSKIFFCTCHAICEICFTLKFFITVGTGICIEYIRCKTAHIH